jgi:O-antigen/teichoic acid export membrane protein
MTRGSPHARAVTKQGTPAHRAGSAPAPWQGSSYSSGLAFSIASFGCIGIVTLATSVISARLYGIAVIGQAALALAPVTIVTLLSTVREQPAMIRELARLAPRHPRVTGVALAVFAFSFALTAVVTAVAIVVCYFVFAGPLHHPKLFLPAAVGLGGYLLIINTCWNADSVFAAFRASRELFVVRLHQAILYGVFVALAITFAHSVWGLVLAFLASWLASFIHRLFLLRRVLSRRVPASEIRAGFATLREIIGFGLKLTPGSLASGFSDASGTWILGVTSTVDAVGAFSRAWGLASRLTELNWRITEMLLPTLVQHQASGDSDRFDRVLVDSMRYSAFGLLLPAAVGGGSADAIMRVFGGGFEAGATALRWLLLVPVLQTLMAIQGTALMASGRPVVTSIVQLVRLVVTLGGGIALTLTLGVTGMALAVVAGALASFCVCVVVLRMRLRTPLPSAAHCKQIAGLAVAYLAGFGLSSVIVRESHGLLGLVAALACGSLAYLLAGIAVGGTTDRDRERITRVVAWISARRAAVPQGLELT